MTKPTNTEDEYFAREEIEKKHKLARELREKQAKSEAEALRKLHWMHCPKCGQELHTIRFRAVDVDRCFNCGGTFLDAGELEKLAGREESHALLSAIVNAFKRPSD